MLNFRQLMFMSFTLSNTDGHLAALLRSRRSLWDDADSDSRRLAHRVSVAVPTWKWRTVLEFDVVVMLSLVEDGGAPDNALRVTWKSADGGRFPSFSGMLRLERDEFRNCRLVLEGGYEEAAAFEASGDAISLDYRICASTARTLLEGVRKHLEAAVQDTPLAPAAEPLAPPAASPRKKRGAARGPDPTLFG